jgi:hypothetical protein
MADQIIVTPVVNELTVTQNVVSVGLTSPGPQGPTGATGAPGVTPIFSKAEILTPYAGTARFYFEISTTITSIRASVGTPSAGSPVVVGIFKNGTRLTTLSIPEGSNTILTTLSAAMFTNDYVTVSIDSVGSTIPGSTPAVGAGNLTLTATANATQGAYPATANASITLTGSATVGNPQVLPATGLGGLTLTASATALTRYASTATSTLSLTGLANAVLNYGATGVGAINVAGAATANMAYQITASGQVLINGSATSRLAYSGAGVGSLGLVAFANASLKTPPVGWGISI